MNVKFGAWTHFSVPQGDSLDNYSHLGGVDDALYLKRGGSTGEKSIGEGDEKERLWWTVPSTRVAALYPSKGISVSQGSEWD